MLLKTDQYSNDSSSTSKNSNDPNKKLRIYYATEKYLDIPLHQFDTNDTYFVKNTESYAELKEL